MRESFDKLCRQVSGLIERKA